MLGFKPRNRKPSLDANHASDYYGKDPYLTTFWNCLSLLFPKGEKFFVDAVRNYRRNLQEKNLAFALGLNEEISAFIGQEAFHSREHQNLNVLIEELGIDVRKFDKELGIILGLAAKLPDSVQLAATCALEHFTGIMGHQLLEDKNHWSNIYYQYYDLWIWHAIEECEHKAVSYDAYKAVCDSYLLRTTVMLAATVVFFAVVVNFYLRMLCQQKLFNPIRFALAIGYLFNLFKDLVPDYFEYFKPGFHPNYKTSTKLVEHWLSKMNLQ